MSQNATILETLRMCIVTHPVSSGVDGRSAIFYKFTDLIRCYYSNLFTALFYFWPVRIWYSQGEFLVILLSGFYVSLEEQFLEVFLKSISWNNSRIHGGRSFIIRKKNTAKSVLTVFCPLTAFSVICGPVVRRLQVSVSNNGSHKLCLWSGWTGLA